MKKFIFTVLLISMTAFANQSAGSASSSGGTVGSDTVDLAVLKVAVSCQIAGVDLLSCDSGKALSSSNALSQEIHRCQKLNDNLLYCLTTSANKEVVSTVEAYAEELYNSKKSIRDTFNVLGALPAQDKVGYINAWTRCQVAGISPKDCL